MCIEKNKLQQLKAFQKNTYKSLQDLINEAYLILGNPIILYDADWKIIAHAEGVVTDDPFWNNHINTGTIDQNIESFIKEGFIDIMTSPDKVVFLNSENTKYNRVFGKVFDKDNNLMAGVSVVASNRPFDSNTLMITEVMCKAFSNEIWKLPEYKNYACKKLETYINMLIKGDIKDKLYISGYVDIVYTGLKDNLYLAVADITQCDPTCSKLDYYRDLFKRTRPAFKYSIYSNYIVIIMSTDEEKLYPKRCFNRLNRLFEQESIKVGISSRFENLFELQRHYNEAVKALTDGLKINSEQWIYIYEDEDRLFK